MKAREATFTHVVPLGCFGRERTETAFSYRIPGRLSVAIEQAPGARAHRPLGRKMLRLQPPVFFKFDLPREMKRVP